jgi:hypothetical protein
VTPTATPSATFSGTVTASPTTSKTTTRTGSPTTTPTWSVSPTPSASPTLGTPTVALTATLSTTPTPGTLAGPGSGAAGQVAKVTLKIYNSAGEVVATLCRDSARSLAPTGLWVQPACLAPGEGRAAVFTMDGGGPAFSWDGSSDKGEMAASGVYLAAVNVDGDSGPVFRVEVCIADGPREGFFDQAFLAPNPASAASMVKLTWGHGPPPAGLEMESRVFDLSGALVAVLEPVANGTLGWVPPPGQASGIYVVQARATWGGKAVRRQFKLAIIQ